MVCGIGLGATASGASAETTVSLTFKDTLISQYNARQALADNEMNGTFYVNSGLIANRAVEITERMSWKQVHDLAADGNEIGGGSRSRLQLDLASASELHAEICDDRAELIRRGYAPVSFGYTRNPQDATAAAKAKIQECGYASARGAGGIGGVGNPVAESVPPLDAYNFRARSINENHALATIKSWVTAAESTGGWLPLIIHSVCDQPGCSITEANFEELVVWLKDRETLPGGGTHVKTVREVMTGTTQPEPPDPIDTTISIAFDDGLDEFSTIAGPTMVANDIRGTFFINSGRVGTEPRFLTWAQIRSLNGAGHEIGGHSINDTNLAGLPANQLNTEVCQDRQTIWTQLNNDGVPGDINEYAPVSYAYSFGAFDAAAKQKVANVTTQCTGFPNSGSLFGGDTGYLSGRAVQGLKWYTRTNRCQLLSCKFDEPIHPADPYELKVIGSVGTDDDLNELKQTVENVYNSGGGWATLVFHEICPGPGVPATPSGSGCPEEDSSTSPEVFEGLMEWLSDPAQSSRGIDTRTIEQVMEDPAEPRPPFDDDDPVTSISCNAGPCGPTFNSNGPVTVALSGSDTGPDSSGLKEIRYAINGVPTGSSPVYSGPFQINSNATVRFRASDNYGNVEKVKTQDFIIDQTAPTSSIQCNAGGCNTHYPAGTVNATLAANDGGGTGVANIRFTTDGSDPTGSSPVYSGAIPVSSTTTIKFRAEDNVGNVESPIKSQTIRIDGVQPESSVLCDGAACAATFYGEVVSATLAATDLPAGPDASGVKNIRYTTDGSAPTGGSAIYTGAIPLSTTTTIKFRAEDNVGNVESPVESQEIKVDLTPPESTVTCDGVPCSLGGYDHVVRMELQTSSPPAEAQPTEIRYTTDGSEPTGSSTLYTGEFFISETSTVKFRATDEAGNVETTKSQLVRIDTTPPTTAVNCNGPSVNCQAAYNSPVTVHLAASDPDGGSVKEIRYTTNGDEPTGASQLYSGPFVLNASATVKFRAEDNATLGNVEATKSQAILIETDAPTSALECDGDPCIGGFYNTPVTASLTANDTGGAGVKNIRFTTDGSPVTGTSPIYLGPFQVNGVTTVRWRAEDNAGNVEAPQTDTINVDTQDPTTTIQCDLASCQTAYDGPVSATLNAIDAGAAGVANIRYTLDGSDPTGSSPVYAGAIPINSTTLIKFRAEDNAGNVEAPIKSRNIVIDQLDPSTAITCNNNPCVPFDDGPVTVALNGSDTGGSGLKEVRYTTDGSAPTAASQLYSGPFVVNTTTQIRFRAEDNVGNLEAPKTQNVGIDEIDPTSTIECDGDPCVAAYPDPVSVTLQGNDTGGAGLKEIRYTTNGSAPTASSTLYTGPIAVNSTTTIRWRAEDNAGNVESPSQTQQVVIDTDGPVTSLACEGQPCSPGGYSNVVRATLSTVTDAPPAEIYYTLDGSEPDENSTLYTGDFFISETTEVKFFAIDDLGTEEPVRTETVLIDTDEPTSAIECNGLPCQAFYNSPVSATLEGDDGSGGGIKEIRYTTNGSAPTASSTLYTGPIAVNSTTTIRWRAEDNAGNVESPANSQTIAIETGPPSTTATCNDGACGGFFNQDVSLELDASDPDSGVKEIRYTTDGSAPNASSTLYSGPIALTETTLVRFRAEDNAGNVEAPQSQNVQIDKLQPDSSIECNGNACVGGFYSGTVSVTLGASDDGDAGVSVIRYTTDGSPVTGSSPVYGGAFNVTETSTIRFRAEDNAGNVESPANSQQIQIENGPPVSSIACDGDDPCKDAYNNSVSATLSAEDDASGVKEIRYTTNGDEPDGTSAIYSSPIPVAATTTIKFRSEDNAGNLEPVKSHTITIEGDAPTSAIECNGAACQAGYYDEQVAVTLTGDDGSGSGIKEIRYTTDGSAPGASSQLYGGPIQLSSSATIRFRAEDHAGNVESPANSQLVEVDVAAPTTQATCNGGACQASYGGPVSVALAAGDNGGSGVKEIRYTTDGSAPSASSPLYAAPIAVNATTTVRFRAEDNTGNLEAAKAQAVKIDQGAAKGKCKKGKKKKGKKAKKCKKKKKKKKK